MLDAITERTIEELKAQAVEQKKALYCWCTDFPNFGVRVTPDGRAKFLVQKWSRGRAIRVTNKLYHPAIKVKAAHDWAAIELAKIVQGNYAAAQQTNLSTDKLEETFRAWFAKHEKPGSYWRGIKRYFEVDIIPAFGARVHIKHIAKADVRKLIEAKQDAGAHAVARALFDVLRPFFKWCVQQDIIAASPIGSLSPPTSNKSRDRYLSPGEIVKLWHAATQLDYPYGHFYKLALLLGQRNETEIGLMQWSEIKDGVWTIPAERVKNKLEHVVHIAPQAQAVLDSIPHTSDYVFTVKGKPINGFASAKVKLDALLRYTKPWVVHDLRRTMVTHMVELGVEPFVSDRILNHTNKARSGIAGVYQKAEKKKERKEAIELYSKWIEGLISAAAHN